MRTFLVAGLLVSFSSFLQAAPDGINPPADTATASTTQTAAGLWTQIGGEGQQIMAGVEKHDAAVAKLIPAVQDDLGRYLTNFPADAHVPEAKLMLAQIHDLAHGLHLPGAPTAEAVDQEFNGLAADASLPLPLRAEASLMTISSALRSARADEAAQRAAGKGHSAQWDDVDAKVSDFEKNFGTVSFNGHTSAAMMLRGEQITLLQQAGDTDRLNALLARLATDPHPDIAALAKQPAAARVQAAVDLEQPIRLPDPTLLNDSEIVQRKNIEAEVDLLLSKNDYDGLESLATKDEMLESPFASGRRPCALFYSEVSCPKNATETGYHDRLILLHAWADKHPDSIAASVALGQLMVNYAWFARGGGYANTVTDDGWKVFSERLSGAVSYLNQVAAKRKTYLGWYSAMLEAGLGQSWDKESYLRVADEACKLHPTNPGPYAQTCIYLLPRWMGSDGDVGAYASKSADAVGGDEGDVLYARIAQRTMNYSAYYDIYHDLGFSWPRVKHGMELLCNRYPHSVTNANWFCLLAVWAKDRPAAAQLFKYLGSHCQDEFNANRTWNDDECVWDTMNYLNESKAWAGVP